MSNRPEEHLDRRDFMIASITTAGTSAALAITAGAIAEALIYLTEIKVLFPNRH